MAQFIPDSLLSKKNQWKFTPEVFPGTNIPITRGSSVVEHGTHNPEVGGAQPSPASLNPNIVLGYN
jgi:hypothetical protein